MKRLHVNLEHYLLEHIYTVCTLQDLDAMCERSGKIYLYILQTEIS